MPQSTDDDSWIGTEQHPQARDLSSFLIHLTTGEDALVDILRTGVIEARNPHGLALYATRGNPQWYSVCFTEMPVPELRRMRARQRMFGLAFSKEKLRLRAGAQPVWYVTDDSAPHNAIRALLATSPSPASNDPVWEVVPFVDLVRNGSNARSPHDWRWEREWRIVGDFAFELHDVAAVIMPRPDGSLEPLRDFELGAPFVTPDGEFFWGSSFSDTWDTAMRLMIEQFRAEFSNPGDAGLYWDPEDHEYILTVDSLDLDQALAETFPGAPYEVLETLGHALFDEGDIWTRNTPLHDTDV